MLALSKTIQRRVPPFAHAGLACSLIWRHYCRSHEVPCRKIKHLTPVANLQNTARPRQVGDESKLDSKKSRSVRDEIDLLWRAGSVVLRGVLSPLEVARLRLGFEV